MNAEQIVEDILSSIDNEVARLKRGNPPTGDNADFFNQGKIEALEQIQRFIFKSQEEEVI